MTKRRVVITGMGAITPYGVGVDTFWGNIKNGKSGIKQIRSMNLEKHSVHIAGEVPEDVDFEKLPDLSAYIESLDMMKIAPQHTNTTGKILIYNSVVGWYEKTENGVYSIVRIAWRYYDQDDYYVEYYDETFILLDEAGDHIVSREELLDLIGENRNISYEEYGVGIDMPMV